MSDPVRVRVTKIDEFQFLTCLRAGLWGSKSARFKDWRMGDYLVLLSGNTVGGLARVSGKPFKKDSRVWDNGLFPHRIPLEFLRVTAEPNRLRVLGEVRDALVQGFPVGGGWGLGILNQRLMTSEAAEKLLALINATPQELPAVRQDIDALLSAAKAKRDRSSARTRNEPAKGVRANAIERADVASSDGREALTESSADNSAHLEAQRLLIELGRTVGCSVWVASNDKSKSVAGRTLGSDCIAELPSMGLGAEASRAIGLIDVIWLRKNAPVAAFEVEATTSVHSGLLRMSDLVELVPALKMDLYVVAPSERQGKVLRELSRPTFRRIGLSDICRFVSIESLSVLLSRLQGLRGFVQPEIIETIAVALPELAGSALS